MTTAIAGGSGARFTTLSTIVPVRGRINSEERSASTLLDPPPGAPWIEEIGSQIVLAARARRIDYDTALTSLSWLLRLPPWMPEPSIGIGDDGTISVEWDRNGRTLHAMFDGHDADFYFEDGQDGEEWETTLTAGDDRVRYALRSIALPL